MLIRKLSTDSMKIEFAETQIKILTKKYWEKNQIQALTPIIDRLIDRTCKSLKDKNLIKPVRTSLRNLARRCMYILINNLGINGEPVKMAVIKYNADRQRNAIDHYNINIQTMSDLWVGQGKYKVFNDYDPGLKGVPGQINPKVYMKKVNDTIDELVKAKGLDPNDVTGKNSLRNLAEMMQRNEMHNEQIQEFKEKGVNLVVCSVHEDCSLRCYHWQGKIYSLDHTSGTTEDGRDYVPLEVATNPENVYYTNPKTGTKYKGGLFGYNCRHKLYEFEPGMGIPRVSQATQQKENEINQKQRWFEREIRKYRELAELGATDEIKKKARKKARDLYSQYVEFSKAHERAFYPDRTYILD